jgi:cell division protein FtsX
MAQPLGDARVDAAQRRSLMLILAGGGCVLLVTCVNVATLLLTRARSRRGEMAIRLALGASRWRLVRQLLTESAVIAAGGGALGVIFASWGVAWLRRSAPDILASAQNNYGQISPFSAPAIDGTVLLFVAVLALATTLVAGAAPALVASSSDPAHALAGSARSLAGRGRARALSGLVVCQIAVAVLLLSGALLLVRTLTHLQEARSGFDSAAVTFWVNPPASRYLDADGPAVVERVLDRIRQIPGCNGGRGEPLHAVRHELRADVDLFPGIRCVPPTRPSSEGTTCRPRACFTRSAFRCGKDACCATTTGRDVRRSRSSTKPPRGVSGRARIRSANACGSRLPLRILPNRSKSSAWWRT